MCKTISPLNTAAQNFEIAYADEKVTDAEIAQIVQANRDRAKSTAGAFANGKALFDAAAADFYASSFKIAQENARTGAVCVENHFPTGEGLDPASTPACKDYNKAITRFQIAAVLVASECPDARLSFGVDSLPATALAPQSWRMSHGY